LPRAMRGKPIEKMAASAGKDLKKAKLDDQE
jgi:hypothetical protein